MIKIKKLKQSANTYVRYFGYVQMGLQYKYRVLEKYIIVTLLVFVASKV